MDSINIATASSLSKDENIYNNGRPTNIVPSQHPNTPLSPLRLENMNINNSHLDTIHSPRREEFSSTDILTPETTPPQPPPQEEKKMRWNLGRKLREKKDKK